MYRYQQLEAALDDGEQGAKPMNNAQQLWPTLKRLLSYGSPYRKPLGLAVLMLWVAAAAEVSGPLLISYFIDHVVAKGTLPLGLVSGLALAYLLLQLLAATLHYFQALLFNRAAVGVVQRLRIDVMDAALRQPLSAFDTQPVGQLISRVTNDTEVIKDLYVMVVSTVLKSAALISAMLVAMFSLDWRMALISICIFPAVLVVMTIYQRYSTLSFAGYDPIWLILMMVLMKSLMAWASFSNSVSRPVSGNAWRLPAVRIMLPGCKPYGWRAFYYALY